MHVVISMLVGIYSDSSQEDMSFVLVEVSSVRRFRRVRSLLLTACSGISDCFSFH